MFVILIKVNDTAEFIFGDHFRPQTYATREDAEKAMEKFSICKAFPTFIVELDDDKKIVSLSNDDIEFLRTLLMIGCMAVRDSEGRPVTTPTEKSHENVMKAAKALGMWDEKFERWWKFTRPGQ